MIIKKCVPASGGKKANRNQKRSYRVKCFFKKLFFWVCFFSFVGVAGWTLFFSSVMKIDAVEVSFPQGAAEDVKNQAESFLAGKIWYFLPKDNFLIMSKKSLIQEIKDSNWKIKNVQIEKEFPTGLQIEVERRGDFIKWCSAGDCYLIDDTGDVFLRIDGFLNGADEEIFTVTDQTEKAVQLGQNFLDQKFVKFCFAVKDEFLVNDFLKIMPQVTTPSYVSEELRLKSRDGFEVWLSSKKDPVSQKQILLEVIKEKVGKENLSKIAYFDLRINGRVTYIYKEEFLKENEEDEEGEIAQED